MATCDPQTLKSDARCLVECTSKIELLASIACSLLKLNGMSCDAATLKNQAACIWPCMSEIELLAAIAYNVCKLSGSFRQYSPDTPGDVIGQIAYRTDCFGFFVWDGTQWILQDPLASGGVYFRPTIVELRQVETLVCPPIAAFTDGMLVVGDDQGTAYRWDTDSTDADDGLKTIKPDDRDVGDPGRWKQRVLG